MNISGWKKWLIVGVIGVGVLITAGPYAYFHFIEGKAPAPLSVSTTDPTTTATATTAAPASVDGTWTVASGSKVGYRVKEILFGQSADAVGRTSGVTGSFVINGTTVSGGSFTADLTTVSSDKSRRDQQFQGRIMNTATYPTGTFALTKQIQLPSIPAVGVKGTATATGSLTLHGVTRTVTFTVTGVRTAQGIQVSGAIPITFADFNIANPSYGPAQTGDTGTLEFLLVFVHG